MLANMLSRCGIRLPGIVARRHRFIGPGPVLRKFHMRDGAQMWHHTIRHRDRRKRLHRQDQQHHDQQESVEMKAHASSVIKKQGQPKRPGDAVQVPWPWQTAS